MTTTKPIPSPPTKYEYEQAEIEIAMQYKPYTYPCVHCHWPVRNGYACNKCGSTTPYRK